MWWTKTANPCAEQSASWSSANPLDRHDPRLLARPGALPRHLLVAASPASGCTAILPPSTTTALWYILGRSDDTIKVAGKRLGPAEVEAILNAHDGVAESAAIGVPHELKGQEVVAFVVLAPGVQASEDLRAELLNLVTAELGKPLKPKAILFAAALPKTRNAKVMRRIIRAAHLGDTLGDVSSLEDAGTVAAIQSAG